LTFGKTGTQILTQASLAISGVSNPSSVIDLNTALDFGIGYTMTFTAACTAGANILLYGDPTAANNAFSIGAYDNYIDLFYVPFVAGQTVNGVIPMLKMAKYVRAVVVNLDTAKVITNIALYSIVQST
jgi:hypothetical protein